MDLLKLGAISIRLQPDEPFENYTVSKKKEIGKIIPFHVTGEKIDIRIGYAIFINGERDVRTLDIQKEFNTFGRLIHGLRLAVQPIPENRQLLYAELRQAIPRDTFSKHETLHPTTSELDLDEGAGISVFSALTMAGAEVGTKQELIGEQGKRSPYLCAKFAKDNLWAPITAYVTTRIMPMSRGFRGAFEF